MSAGFLALLDDVAAIMSKAAASTKMVATSLDDVAAMTGAGAKGASAIVIDDIPVNAQAVTEFQIDPKKEIPIIKAIEKGSMINKLIAIPLALLLNQFAPFLLTPVLALGGAYLGYEGAEKVIHAIKHKFFYVAAEEEETSQTAKSQEEFEHNLVKGAIRTDLVMSIEIIFIALASIKELYPDSSWIMLLITLLVIGFFITKVIYGLVKGLIRLDDLALHLDTTALDNKVGALKKRIAAFIIKASPVLLKVMSVVGAAAMVFISGELIAMQFTFIEDWVHILPEMFITKFIGFSLVGLAVGTILIGVFEALDRIPKPAFLKK
ncbi:MAG: DUF808 family protein [Pseudobdellovibrionaceae bacterium]|jgi:predicted DNA repair protein MutK|nr:DUF808 family protein [Pseudobdellovibrionaceae bacterium]